MMDRVGEQIRVGAVHGPGSRLRPVWFDWRRRKHDIREITYHWRHREGSDLILHYAVTDGTALYELIYNATQQVWMLHGVAQETS